MIRRTADDRSLPSALADVARAEFDHADGEGIDFEPCGTFDSAGETADRLRQWTGNRELDGDAHRVFGRDGTGGLAAVRYGRPGRPLAERPVVFMGSEGECGAVAGNLSDLLWVPADGRGPLEAVLYEDRGSRPDAALTELAERRTTTPADRPASSSPRPAPSSRPSSRPSTHCAAEAHPRAPGPLTSTRSAPPAVTVGAGVGTSRTCRPGRGNENAPPSPTGDDGARKVPARPRAATSPGAAAPPAAARWAG